MNVYDLRHVSWFTLAANVEGLCRRPAENMYYLNTSY